MDSRHARLEAVEVAAAIRGSKCAWWMRRALEIVLTLVLLVGASPVMLLVATAIRAESSGPAIYRQRRVGLKGSEFTLLKFRSMRVDAERASGPVWAREHDDRVTRVGGIIRRLRFDELPQLLNVLHGEMSLVGPRPERPYFVKRLERLSPDYRKRLSVHPGITGWAQVRMGYASSVAQAMRKLDLDLYYVEHRSPLLDARILVETVRVVVRRNGAR